MTALLAMLRNSPAFAWAVQRAAAADLDVRAVVLYARGMFQKISTLILTLTAVAWLTACPKPQPDPVPAGPCGKPGQACADEPHHEGPPPVGTLDPPK